MPFLFGKENEGATHLESLFCSIPPLFSKHLVYFLSIISCDFGIGYARKNTGLEPSFNSNLTRFLSQATSAI